MSDHIIEAAHKPDAALLALHPCPCDQPCPCEALEKWVAVDQRMTALLALYEADDPEPKWDAFAFDLFNEQAITAWRNRQSLRDAVREMVGE